MFFSNLLRAATLLCAIAELSPAQITRDNYYRYVPAMPKLVTQTNASERFQLYGDRSRTDYRDEDVNGMDDRRQLRLHAIAVRFSPILRRNNYSFPQDFKRALVKDELYVDTWRAGRLVKTDSIPLGWSQTTTSKTDVVDARLTEVLRQTDPLAPEPRFIRADQHDEQIMYIDFPGSDPVSWRAAYKDADPRDAAFYTHFLIHEDTAATGDHRYHLVAQQFFFYPFNDAANNHEGDWEHINVLITTLQAAEEDSAGRMTATEVEGVLGADDVETTVVAYVDYHFHESLITLDYLALRRPAGPVEKSWLRRLSVWRDTTYISRTLLSRSTVAGGALATHPIGYIGGNNKGPDELLAVWPRFQRSYNRNGHGTYPFPGTWQHVGPLSSTEQLSGPEIPKLHPKPTPDMLLRDLVTDPDFIVFEDANVIIVPDWERIHALLPQSRKAQRDWSWLVLPMRWGFPVSVSPGGGALPHTDVGNISPEAPPYQPTWNRVGIGAGWRAYEPEVLRVLLTPTSPWDHMKNGWGVLNVPVALLGFLPGWNVAATQVMPWLSGTLHVLGASPARTFNPNQFDSRFTSITVGRQQHFGGAAFARMLPDDSSEVLTPEMRATKLWTARRDRAQGDADGMRIGMQLHYGERFSVENTYAQSMRALTAVKKNADGTAVAHLSGSIDTRDITGGVRYDIVKIKRGLLNLFVRGGYGWTWYKVDHVTVNGSAADYTNRGGYAVSLLPSKLWWPNTWYGGAGLELYASRQSWLLPQLGYGLRLEANGSRHRLGATRPGTSNLGIVSRGDLSVSAVIGW